MKGTDTEQLVRCIKCGKDTMHVMARQARLSGEVVLVEYQTVLLAKRAGRESLVCRVKDSRPVQAVPAVVNTWALERSFVTVGWVWSRVTTCRRSTTAASVW